MVRRAFPACTFPSVLSAKLIGLARVTSFENRFDEFRKTVRPHSVYGYVSDNAPNDPSTLPEFYLTQYTLAPALVKSTAEEPLVIVNFHSGKPDYGLLRANKLALVRDLGNGVQ